jgi:hypothetical protein
MKILRFIILPLIFVCSSYAQLDYPTFEIFTRTTGSTGDTIRFWMLAESQIWDKDDEPDSLEMQRITCSFDSAHATHYNYTSRKGVPVPNSGDNYGIWSVLNGSGGPAYTHHTYG